MGAEGAVGTAADSTLGLSQVTAVWRPPSTQPIRSVFLTNLVTASAIGTDPLVPKKHFSASPQVLCKQPRSTIAARRTVVGKKEEESQRDRQNKSLNGTAKCPKG